MVLKIPLNWANFEISIFSQSRQIQVPQQSEDDIKHFKPKFAEREKRLKQLQTEKVDQKKKNALLTKRMKEVNREIEDLERRKKTVDKFSAGNRQFTAVKNSALKSHAILSSQSSSIKRTDSQATKQPAEKRPKIESNTKTASNRFLTPPPKSKTLTPRKNTKPRPNLKTGDASALFEENEQSMRNFEIPTSMDVKIEGTILSTEKSETKTETQTQKTQSSDSDSSRDSYGLLSPKDLSENSVWLSADKMHEDFENEVLNSCVACYPGPKESPKSQAQMTADGKSSSKKSVKVGKRKHREVVEEFAKSQKLIQNTRNTIKGHKFGKPGPKRMGMTDFNENIALHGVKQIEPPEFRVAEEKVNYDYHDDDIVSKPSWFQTKKCIPPKRFGTKNSVKKVPVMKANIQSLSDFRIREHNNDLVKKIKRVVISEESIKQTEFVTYAFHRIIEFTKLISEDRNKCYLYYFQNFYKLLDSVQKAIHTAPTKDWL